MTSIDRDRVVLLTHFWNDRLARHYARLRRQISRVHSVFLVFQSSPGGSRPPEGVFDLVVDIADAAQLFPRRYQQYLADGASTLMGRVEMIWLTAFLNERLAAFDRFWLVEYDVDFSGDWGRFFSEARTLRGDVVATHLRWRKSQPDWNLLSSVVDPRRDPSDHVIGFFPISRFSRQFVEHYRSEVLRDPWAGHFELLVPTIAVRGGFEVADIGGTGEFTPPERRGRDYEGDYTTLAKAFYTFGYRPARSQHYVAERAFGYWQRNRLYHPVKIELDRKDARWARWLCLRDGTRRRVARLLGREPRFSDQR